MIIIFKEVMHLVGRGDTAGHGGSREGSECYRCSYMKFSKKRYIDEVTT